MMRRVRHSMIACILAGVTLTGAGGLAAGAPTVRAASPAAVCPGYSTATCRLITLPPHSIKRVSVKKARGLKLVITTGATSGVMMVKTVAQPAGSPTVPGSEGKETAFFMVQTLSGTGDHVSARGEGTLYAYDPATNGWSRVGTNDLTSGTIYAWVPGKARGKTRSATR